MHDSRVRIFANNLIFFDIPKAASTAIKRSFGLHQDSIAWQNGEKWSLVPDESKESHYSFTFIRHPYDRVLSTFAMYQRLKKDTPEFREWDHIPTENLDDFINYVVTTEGDRHITIIEETEEQEEIHIEKFIPIESEVSWHLHVRPLHTFLPIENNKPKVDFIGRFESLIEDWSILQKKFGLEDLPSKESQDHVTNHTLKLTKQQGAILEDYYSRDFELFDFNPKDFVT